SKVGQQQTEMSSNAKSAIAKGKQIPTLRTKRFTKKRPKPNEELKTARNAKEFQRRSETTREVQKLNKFVTKHLPYNNSKLFHVPVTIQEHEVRALGDTGSSCSIIDEELVVKLKLEDQVEKSTGKNKIIELACGEKSIIQGTIEVDFE